MDINHRLEAVTHVREALSRGDDIIRAGVPHVEVELAAAQVEATLEVATQLERLGDILSKGLFVRDANAI